MTHVIGLYLYSLNQWEKDDNPGGKMGKGYEQAIPTNRNTDVSST